MNWQLNTGWKYPFAKTQEQWDAMTDRAAIIDPEVEYLAKVMCRESEDARRSIEEFVSPSVQLWMRYEREARMWRDAIDKYRSLAAVPPPPSDGTPVDRVISKVDSAIAALEGK